MTYCADAIRKQYDIHNDFFYIVQKIYLLYYTYYYQYKTPAFARLHILILDND